MTIDEFYTKYSGSNDRVETLVSIIKKFDPTINKSTKLDSISQKDLMTAIAKLEDNKGFTDVKPLLDALPDIPKIENKPVQISQESSKVVKPTIKKNTEINKPTIIDNIVHGLNNLVSNIGNNSQNYYDYAKRAWVKYGLGDAGEQTSKVQNKVVSIVPQKQETKSIEKNEITREDKTVNLPVKPYYKKLATTPEGYVSYINMFDNDKGFDYVATARTEKDSIYNNVEHMAHFLYDKDFTTGKSADNSEAAKLDRTKDKSKFKANNPGSTVKDPYFTVYKKNSDNKTVNVKYIKASELKPNDNIGDPLRQYKFSDIDWGSHMPVKGFNSTIEGLITNDQKPTYFINPKGQKDAYGKFGGNPVLGFILLVSVGIF
jgi:hypothetical protein